GPALVAVGDLSAKPSPPANLNRLLQQEYPDEARAQGVEGKARIRIRVGPDGGVRVLSTLSEDPSGMGFGDACRRLMRRAGRWSSPRDQRGRPVATVAPFTCNFTIRY
ncbi:MAG TPA: TonB family protein, partial [Polyangiaceae bacterium LLY-WYZ-14_1]|nr:TonB family protein [Polyangiaceae bacterium LLY-WYZ-14_1]